LFIRDTMKTAIVFDSAGTLLKVYRVARDVNNKKIIENVVSTNMVIRGRGCALVALQVDSVDFLDSADPGSRISDYMSGANIGFDVICRGIKCTHERINEAIARDVTASMGDMKEAIEAVKLKCKDIYYLNIGLVVDVPHGSIPYVLATGGRTFPGVRDMVKRLMASGVDVYIASGDNRKSLTSLADDLGVPRMNVFDAVSPKGKEALIKGLKERYDRVLMVGDGVNDYLALQAADVGILSLQQEGMKPDELLEASDVTVGDILEVESVVEESLHTNKKNKNR
jgi:soluble P-type ATPase